MRRDCPFGMTCGYVISVLHLFVIVVTFIGVRAIQTSKLYQRQKNQIDNSQYVTELKS